MQVHVRGHRLHAGLKGPVQLACLLPVQRQRQDLHGVDACVQISAMQRVDDGAHGGLACGPTHGVHAAVDNVRARCSCRQLCGHASARRVVGVHVDHQVGEALAQRAHKHGGGLGLEQACHVLDGQGVDAMLDQLLCQIHIVIQRVLCARWVGHVAGVAQRGFSHTASSTHAVHPKLQVVDVVQGVKHSEDVHSAQPGLPHKCIHRIVRV
mmetsp:Transcript_16708/g.45983  ORF Transcript_16708/g.45983 Transcript_16708/m.45983 type:complete len:210 (-) Transcript_16708:2157-2786(-)